MKYSTLKTAIRYTEEKNFYDISLLYLRSRGYGELCIVDGPGDGGIDVTSNKKNVRIQLSVRKDWEKKINDEARKAVQAGSSHLVYITNRDISSSQEASFLANKFKYKSEVDLSIHPLEKIATALSMPEFSKKSYELLGIAVPERIDASLKDIATSTLLLFSQEAKQLRDEIVDANIKSILFKKMGLGKFDLENEMVSLLSDDCPDIRNLTNKAIPRLLGSGVIVQKNNNISLSSEAYAKISIANDNFVAMKSVDIDFLSGELEIEKKDAEVLLNSALEVLVRDRNLEGDGALEEELRSIISKPVFRRAKYKIFEALSKTNIAKFKQHGVYVDHILKTNTFDIYRALGQRAQIVMLLDSSVAMPIMFGLEYGDSTSRFEITARALLDVCKTHEITIYIPDKYLNEMASHGRLALERLDAYEAMPSEAKSVLKFSDNAYLAHYTHINEKLQREGDSLTSIEFLSHFGIKRGVSIISIENKLESILERHGINIIKTPTYDSEYRIQVKKRKPSDLDIIIDHDAAVLTLVKENIEKGFVLATWDYALRDLVQNLARVLADTPTRVIDFLSMAKSENISPESSVEIINTLMLVDDAKVVALAEKLDKIKSVTQAQKLQALIDESRQKYGSDWELGVDAVQSVLNNKE